MKRKALIIDIDGTLSDNTHRLHLFNKNVKDWTEINELSRYDLPNLWCQSIVHLFGEQGYKIIFMTGRSEEAERVTREWLMRYVSPAIDWTLLMRGKDDRREDFEIKEDLYCQHVAPLYDVEFCVDDRDQNVQMFRRIGLVCLQCKENTY